MGGAERNERFERLYREVGPAVLAYALRRTDFESAQDAVAETFLVIWRRLDEMPEESLPWFYGIARRTLSNQRRAAIRRDRLALRASLNMPVAADPIDGRMLDALASLPEPDRELLMLIAWEGLSPAQAARVLGCSANACRIRLHRARRRLDHALAHDTPWRLTGSRPGEVR